MFNRVAKGLWRVGISVFKLNWCNYFDDIPMAEPTHSQRSAQHCAEFLMAVLGWWVSTSAEKCLPFQAVFPVLGVEF